MLALLLLRASNLPNGTVNLVNPKEYDEYDEYAEEDSAITTFGNLLMFPIMIYGQLPLFGFFVEDKVVGRFTKESITPALIRDTIFYHRSLEEINKIWELIEEYASLISSDLRIRDILNIFDIDTSFLPELAQMIRNQAAMLFETKVETSIIESILSNWESIKGAINAVGFDEDATEKGLRELISHEECTINDILVKLNINNQTIIETIDYLTEGLEDERTTVRYFLKFFGIRITEFESIISDTIKFLKKKEITNTEFKEFAPRVFTFAFDTAGCIIGKVVDIVNSSIYPMFKHRDMTFTERINNLATGLNGVFTMLQIDPENSYKGNLIEMISKLANYGIGFSDFITETELIDEIIQKVTNITTGKENLYTSIKFLFEDIIGTNVFQEIEVLANNATTISELLDLAPSDIILDFLKNFDKMNNENINVRKYNCISDVINLYIQYSVSDVGREIMKFLNSTVDQIINNYNSNESLFTNTKTLRSAIDTCNILLSAFKDNINKGNGINASIHAALSSVPKEVYEPYFSDVIRSMNQSLFYFTEWITIFDQLNDKIKESKTLEDLYNGVYEIDWSNVTNFSRYSNDDNKGIVDIIEKISIDKICRMSILNNLLSYYYDYNSIIANLITFSSSSDLGNTQNLLNVIDWIGCIFLNGRIRPFYQEDSYYLQDYLKGTVGLIRRIRNGLMSENAVSAMSSVDFKFLFDIVAATNKSIRSLGNNYAVALTFLAKPYSNIIKLFANGFSNKDMTNLINTDIDPLKIARIIDLFLDYADAVESNSSLIEVFKKHTGFDGPSILKPIEGTLQFIHDLIGLETPHSKLIQDFVKVTNFIRGSSADIYEHVFGIDYTQFYYDPNDGCTKLLETAFNKFINKEFLNCNASFLVSKCDQLLYFTQGFDSIFDANFTLRSFIDNTEFFFTDAFKKVAAKYDGKKAVIDIIKEQKLGPFNIKTSLININSLSIHNVKQFANAVVSYDGKSDLKIINQFCKGFVETTMKTTVANLSNYIGFDISTIFKLVMETKNTLLTSLPKSGSILSQTSFKIINDIVNELRYSAFTAKSLESYFNQFVSSLFDETTQIPTPEITPSNECGIKATYTIDNNILTISGIGATYDYDSESPWINKDSSIKSIVIEEGIKTIGNNLFANLKTFESIILPESITKIGVRAFNGCEKLTSITIPASVREIGDLAFGKCTALSDVIYQGVSDVKYTGTPFSNTTIINVSSNYESWTFAGAAVYRKEIYEGNCGTEAKYVLNTTSKILIINGKGKTENNHGKSIWADYMNHIETIIISDEITSIANHLFYGLSNAVNINIPDAVKEIGDYAFAGSAIIEVQIKQSIEKFGKGAFGSCKNLRNVNIEEGLKVIGEHAFENCTSISNITIPSSIESFGEYAFSNCRSIQTVTFSFGLKTIGIYAFSFCVSIQTLTLPSGKNPSSRVGQRYTLADEYTGIESIGEGAFSSCTNLKSISIPASVKEFGSYAFENCEALEEVVLSEGLKEVGNGAFKSCSALENISIPETIEVVGGEAFKSCSALKNINLPAKLTTIGDSAFASCSSLQEIKIPKTVTTFGEKAFANCVSLNNVTLEEGLSVIGNQTFASCSALEKIEIPQSIEKMGDSIFDSCEKLTTIKLPAGIETIKDGFFKGCNTLKTYDIPNTVKTLGKNAFYQCTGLESVTISSSVEELGDGAFSGCTSLNNIVIPSNVKILGAGAFKDCHSLDTITLSDNIATIDASTFESCTKLSTIALPQKVKEIGNSAFYGCEKLTNVLVKGQSSARTALEAATPIYTSIGDNAFKGCTSLEQFDLPETLLTIGSGAFAGCSKLTLTKEKLPSKLSTIGNEAFTRTLIGSVEIPQTAKTIGEAAFAECSQLKAVKLPSNLEKVEAKLFMSCKLLNEIIIPSNTKEIGQRAFYECELIKSIDIPASVAKIGDEAFGYCTGLTNVTFNGTEVEVPEDARPFSNCDNLKLVKVPYNFKGEKFCSIAIERGAAPETPKPESSSTGMFVGIVVACVIVVIVVIVGVFFYLKKSKSGESSSSSSSNQNESDEELKKEDVFTGNELEV